MASFTAWRFVLIMLDMCQNYMVFLKCPWFSKLLLRVVKDPNVGTFQGSLSLACPTKKQIPLQLFMTGQFCFVLRHRFIDRSVSFLGAEPCIFEQGHGHILRCQSVWALRLLLSRTVRVAETHGTCQ